MSFFSLELGAAPDRRAATGAAGPRPSRLLLDVPRMAARPPSPAAPNVADLSFAQLLTTAGQVWLGQSSGTAAGPDRGSYVARAANPGIPFDHLLLDAGRRYNVDPALLRAMVKAESNFNPRAVSRAGAKGLMQLVDGTGRRYGVSNPFDPAQNVNAGTAFLASLLQKYHGSVPLALAAYNAGPGAVDKYGGVPPYAETHTYLKEVLGLRKEMS